MNIMFFNNPVYKIEFNAFLKQHRHWKFRCVRQVVAKQDSTCYMQPLCILPVQILVENVM